MNRQKKIEKFINAFCSGMDDEILEQALRTAYLGEPEEKFEQLVERHRKDAEEYASKFELTDVTQTVLTEEEIAQITANSVNGDNNTLSISDKGHDNVPSEHTTDDGSSPER